MNESGQVYNYNKLRTIRTLTDIISQCIVAFAFSAFVILGLTNKSDSYIIATLLMAVPVIITYVARKNIHKNFLFMLIHAALLITAIIICNSGRQESCLAGRRENVTSVLSGYGRRKSLWRFSRQQTAC